MTLSSQFMNTLTSPKTVTSPNQFNRTLVTSPDQKSPAQFNLEDETSPSPHTYDARINSCRLAEHRRISFTKAKRFIEPNKPSALPTAGLYDTRPAVRVLLKEYAKVKFPQAKRDISPPPLKSPAK